MTKNELIAKIKTLATFAYKNVKKVEKLRARQIIWQKLILFTSLAICVILRYPF
jgi:hypothetical protein